MKGNGLREGGVGFKVKAYVVPPRPSFLCHRLTLWSHADLQTAKEILGDQVTEEMFKTADSDGG